MMRFLAVMGITASLATLAALVVAAPAQEGALKKSTEESRKVALQVVQ